LGFEFFARARFLRLIEHRLKGFRLEFDLGSMTLIFPS
jgi:hypothetical protein